MGGGGGFWGVVFMHCLDKSLRVGFIVIIVFLVGL